MLWAEVTVGDVGGTAGLIGGSLGFLSVFTSAFFAYRSASDKLKYDAKIIELTLENKRLANEEKECRDNARALSETVARLEQKMESERERSKEERIKLEQVGEKRRDMLDQMNAQMALLQRQLHDAGVDVKIKPIKVDDSRTGMPKPPEPPSESEPF